jgi:DNA helicase-2/ATP-dependent DNA helicase PcrA
VLTTRIAWLMQTGQVSPGGVLAVTFTNKAAKEMLTRLSAMLPVAVRGMWIGTFHGLCNRFLRAHWKLAGLPQGFQILDSSDQLSAVKRVIKAMNLDEERFVPKQVTWFIAARKEDGERPRDVEVRDEQTRKLVEIYQAYEEQCQREGVVDFAELMLRTYELLRDNDPLREHYQRRFRHILVDEFQDTNKLQYAWLKMFAPRPHRRVCFAVGDDDQSIYAFRGARVGNMADFEREYRVSGHQAGAELPQLRQHPRRRQRADRAQHAAPGQEPAHRPGRRAGARVRGHQRLRRGAVVARGGAATAPRRHAAQRDRAALPQQCAEPRAGKRAVQRRHALPRLRRPALLRARRGQARAGLPAPAREPQRRHQLPARGELPDARHRRAHGRAVAGRGRASGRSLAQSVGAVPGKAGSQPAGLRGAGRRMREATKGLTLREIIEHVLQPRAGGLLPHRQGRPGPHREPGRTGQRGRGFVTQEGFGKDAVALPVDEQGRGWRAAVPDADADTGEIMSPLAAFLTHASLEAGDNQAQAGQDAIQLMTVHSAKGLEFDAVFITGIEEGLFPHENSLSDADGVEEERRLMYVAITRARKRLYLSFSQTRMLHGQTRYNVKSRFFDELPEAR